MTVFLVGAGPGDPGLITARGLELIRSCDVLVHDRLVAEELVAEAPDDAISIGRERLEQDEINRLLVLYGLRGLTVVRLKGGDPFVFGRGGEEALALRRAGVAVEVIPGVSSGIAAPARAGIPLTHRGLSSSAAFVTAHDLLDGSAAEAVVSRLSHLARGADTLVVFMAGAHLARLAAVLLAAGLDRATPAATIENGTLPGARVRHGRLDELESLGVGRGTGPLLVVVGRTAALASDLAGPLAAGARLAAETGAGGVAVEPPETAETAAIPFRRTGR